MNYFSDSDDRVIKIIVDKICNLRCTYCLNTYDFNNNNVEYLLSDGINELIKNTKIKDTDRIEILGGGEPLVDCNYEHIKRLILYARDCSKKCNIILTTNGTLLKDEKLDFLINNNVILKVSCDIIGCEQRLFKDGKGSLNLVLKNIKNIICKYNIHPILDITVTESNIDFLYNSLIEFNKLGIRRIILGVETVFYKDKYGIYKTLKDDEFYLKLDNITKDISINTNIRFLYQLSPEYRIKINENVFVSWCHLLSINKRDPRNDHIRLMCREMDKLEYADRNNDKKYPDNYKFLINREINDNILSFDVILNINVLRIRTDKLVMFSNYIKFDGIYLKYYNFISLYGKFNRTVYDKIYKIYYSYFDIIGEVKNGFEDRIL